MKTCMIDAQVATVQVAKLVINEVKKHPLETVEMDQYQNVYNKADVCHRTKAEDVLLS